MVQQVVKDTEMSRSKSTRNNVRTLREEVLMSKAELARRAGVSPLTIDRVESGLECRLDTKRKIILALGKKLRPLHPTRTISEAEAWRRVN
jgi:DNA-binding XRE family transcriptional regulator